MYALAKLLLLSQAWSILIKSSSAQLNLANKILMQKDVIKMNYQNILTKCFKVDVETEDFRTNADQILKKIMSWVAGKIYDKIQNILRKKSVSELTRLVLVNAIFFKEKWKSQLRQNNTEKYEFHMKRNESEMVDLMFQESKFRLSI